MKGEIDKPQFCWRPQHTLSQQLLEQLSENQVSYGWSMKCNTMQLRIKHIESYAFICKCTSISQVRQGLCYGRKYSPNFEDFFLLTLHIHHESTLHHFLYVILTLELSLMEQLLSKFSGLMEEDKERHDKHTRWLLKLLLGNDKYHICSHFVGQN